MKGKNVVVVLVIAAIVVVGAMVLSKVSGHNKNAKVPGKAGLAGQKAAVMPVKKVFAKDMGGLTLKILNSKGKELYLKGRVFKSVDSKTSIYNSAITANKMQDLSAGTYDVELDTMPQRICKDIKVSQGKENIADMGALGVINVKALNYQKKDANYPIRIFFANSNAVVASGSANKPIDLSSGTYDMEIGTMPTQVKKNIKVDSGKETALDIGYSTGAILVKALDENNKAVRYSVRVRQAEKNDLITSSSSNRPIELLQGNYNVELVSNPAQIKKDVVVKAGEETTIEFTVQTPAPSVQAPVKTSSRTKR